MIPDDMAVGGNPSKRKCIHNEDTWIVYLANPDGNEPRTDNGSIEKAWVNITLPGGDYGVKWFDPSDGMWYTGDNIIGGAQKLTAPEPDYAQPIRPDWILLIQKQ